MGETLNSIENSTFQIRPTNSSIEEGKDSMANT